MDKRQTDNNFIVSKTHAVTRILI